MLIYQKELYFLMRIVHHFHRGCSQDSFPYYSQLRPFPSIVYMKLVIFFCIAYIKQFFPFNNCSSGSINWCHPKTWPPEQFNMNRFRRINPHTLFIFVHGNNSWLIHLLLLKEYSSFKKEKHYSETCFYFHLICFCSLLEGTKLPKAAKTWLIGEIMLIAYHLGQG